MWMDKKSLTIVLKQSKYILIYLILVHATMLATVVSLLNSIGLSLLAIAGVLASFIFYCQRYQWIKSDNSITKVEYDDKNRWQIYYYGGSVKQKLALKHCVVTSQLILLTFSADLFWRARSVTIMADAVDADLFRQLRVRLRDIKTFQQ